MSNLHAGGIDFPSEWVRVDQLAAGDQVRYEGILWTVHEIVAMTRRGAAAIATGLNDPIGERTALPFTSRNSSVQRLTEQVAPA